MIAEKCVNITGYGPNFNLENDHDSLTILANSSFYYYTGQGVARAFNGSTTNTSIIGLKSEKNMIITFIR